VTPTGSANSLSKRCARPVIGACAAALALSLLTVAAARAAPVLHVTAQGTTVENEPALDGASALGGPVASLTAPVAPLAGQPVRLARTDAVRRTVRRAQAHRMINAAQRRHYLGVYSHALRVYRSLGGSRRAELGYVIHTVQRLARAKRLGGRLPPMFLMLDRNVRWWSKAGPPGIGARLRFGSSRVIFQYFPGEGLQLHPLANFGQANGFWYARRNGDLRSLLNDLLALRVNRGGFPTWEYYFFFGGGSPPWMSAMAQATAMQALTRASARLSDPYLLEVARRARRAFERRTPVGVRARHGSRVWYPLYSFAPRLNILNAMLQAVNGLRTYAEYAKDRRAMRLFRAGDRTARAVIRSYDTGAWSLYNRPFGQLGPEANLNYHILNRDFSRNLCRATKARAYCRASDRFTRYLREDPRLKPYRAVPSPATAGRAVTVRFRLSKVGRVGIVVRDSAGGRTYLATSASFNRGNHSFRWFPPARGGTHTYQYKLAARDLAGNSRSVTGSVRVRPRR
jgi:hypothetical protein